MENVNVEVKQSVGYLNRSLNAVKKIPTNLKEFFVNLYKNYSASWKLQLILKVFVILLLVNTVLMEIDRKNEDPNAIKHYNLSIDENIFTNAFYLTTTQLSTIGYGDITPKTPLAKLVASFAHFAIMFIGYSIAEEFGAISKTASRQENLIKNNFKNECSVLTATPDFKEEVMREFATQKKDVSPVESREPRKSWRTSVQSVVQSNKRANNAVGAINTLQERRYSD